MKLKRDPLDAAVSDYVRTRDNWQCQRCLRQFTPPTIALHCSHFKSRAHTGTRYDELNCDALCYGCHSYFGKDPEQYEAWKVRRIGRDAVDILKYRARHPLKMTKAEKQLLLALFKRKTWELEKSKKWNLNVARGTNGIIKCA